MQVYVAHALQLMHFNFTLQNTQSLNSDTFRLLTELANYVATVDHSRCHFPYYKPLPLLQLPGRFFLQNDV